MSSKKMLQCAVCQKVSLKVLRHMNQREKGAVFVETAMIVGFLLGLCLLLLVAGTHIVRYLQVTNISQQAIRFANSIKDLPVDGCHTSFPNGSPFLPIIDRVQTLFAMYRSYSDDVGGANILAPFYLRGAPSQLEVCHAYRQGNSGPTEITIVIGIPIEALFGASGFTIGSVAISTTGPYLFEDI